MKIIEYLKISLLSVSSSWVHISFLNICVCLFKGRVCMCTACVYVCMHVWKPMVHIKAFLNQSSYPLLGKACSQNLEFTSLADWQVS